MIKRIINKIILLFKKKELNPYHDYPFGRKPIAPKDKYIEIWKNAKSKSYYEMDNYETELDYSIDKEWLDELALHTQVVIKKSDICYQHGRILFSTLCHYIKTNIHSSINIVEVGTARGFSALCMAKALKFMEVKGNIITIDPLPHDIKMYWNCIDDLNGEKTRKELLIAYNNLIEEYIKFIEGTSKKILNKIKFHRIHFAFIDGTHEYDNIIYEFKQIMNNQHSGDIIVFDDYTSGLFPGVVKAVDEICNTYKYSKNVIQATNDRGYVIAAKE